MCNCRYLPKIGGSRICRYQVLICYLLFCYCNFKIRKINFVEFVGDMYKFYLLKNLFAFYVFFSYSIIINTYICWYSENCLKWNRMGPTKIFALSNFPLYSIKQKNSRLFNSNKLEIHAKEYFPNYCFK